MLSIMKILKLLLILLLMLGLTSCSKAPKIDTSKTKSFQITHLKIDSLTSSKDDIHPIVYTTIHRKYDEIKSVLFTKDGDIAKLSKLIQSLEPDDDVHPAIATHKVYLLELSNQNPHQEFIIYDFDGWFQFILVDTQNKTLATYTAPYEIFEENFLSLIHTRKNYSYNLYEIAKQ